MSSGRGAPRPAGGGPKRAFKPNLAVAGKRETPASENSQQRQTTSTANNRSGNGRDGDRGRGRGRGGRGGRGRGGGAADRPALIVSEGIFSSGLNDERAAGRSAAGGVGGAGESLRFGRGRVKNEQISGGIEGGLRSAATYEEEWLSGDEEADAEALADLVHVGFISDLNSGDLAPLALPLSEARIFIDEEPEKESAKLPAVEDSKEAVREQIKKQRQNQRRIDSESPTPQLVGGGPIGNAFDELNRKAKSVNEPADFVFMQLPDTLSDMLVQGGKLVKKEPVAGEEAME
uniref:Uncharacterized protein n=1 Tax=Plectus sambesii TaxID=2011161 RepID=A0A914XIA4_9BILA